MKPLLQNLEIYQNSGSVDQETFLTPGKVLPPIRTASGILSRRLF
jgi:hypothetical protein